MFCLDVIVVSFLPHSEGGGPLVEDVFMATAKVEFSALQVAQDALNRAVRDEMEASAKLRTARANERRLRAEVARLMEAPEYQ